MVDPLMPGEPEQDFLAAELALDLLTGPEKAHALRLQLADLSFAQDVDAWRTRLAPLYAEFEEMAAPDTIWDATVPRLGISPVVNANESPSSTSRIRTWKAVAVTATALAACLVLLLVAGPSHSPTPSSMAYSLAIASLTGDAKEQLVTIAYAPADSTLHIASAGLQSGAKVPELWIIPADGKPRSLGFIQAAGTSRLKVVDTRASFLVAGTMLAVTMEDASPVPHDAPGSTPILTGKISFP